MFSPNSIRIGATAASNLTKKAGASIAATIAPSQLALGAFRAPPARGFMAATAAAAAATTPKTTKKGASTGAGTKKAKAPTKKAAAAAAAEKKKAAAAKKKAAEKKAAEQAKKKKAAEKEAAKKAAKKAMTPEEKTKLQVRELKKVALLKEPSKLPEHPWILYIAEATKGTKTEDGNRANLAKIMPELSQSFKVLPPLELQRLRDTADKNREANAAAHKVWVESHTAAQIVDANRARLHLNRIAKTKHRTIQDGRLPKRPTSSFSIFTKERWESGQFSGRPLAEAARTLAAEWKSLSPSQRQHYDDISKSESERYGKEVESILGRPAKSPSPAP